MRQIGMDIGTSTVRLAVLEDGQVTQTWSSPHHGLLRTVVRQALGQLTALEGEAELAVTGSNAHVLAEPLALGVMDEIPAIVEGARHLVPEVGSIMEIGSQNSRFITGLSGQVPRFSVNEHCAGGTGSFFEDQMSRLGMSIEDYSDQVAKARSVPRLSGRCSVFAKTDIIHRQQEGVPTPDILLGLCYAMIRNYKAVIVRDLPVAAPVVFCGGVTANAGVRRAIQEVFRLEAGQLKIPELAPFAAAIGAAVKAQQRVEPALLLSLLDGIPTASEGLHTLPPLRSEPEVLRPEPTATGVIPPEGCALGIDIGSTSTDLVLVGRDGTLIHHQYLRTAGDPEGAVRRGLEAIEARFGSVHFLSTGITGSGRERLGRLMGVDVIRDEITAQARAAVALDPLADTVFEIGGQDSKFIAIKDGAVTDFQMNKICAAGTGSFVEEQAARMDIPLADFGPLALTARAPVELGERCTVFIETAIASAAAEGAGQADLAAGLCWSIVRNYLHKVVGSKPVGEDIVLQGGVAYNPAIVAAFRGIYGDRLTVSPYFPISGAYGAALLALEQGEGVSHFHGLDGIQAKPGDAAQQAQVKQNKVFYNKAAQLLLADYDGTLDPKKKTVGIPYVLMIHKFFPLANAFFKALGFNVLLTKPTDEDTIRLSQQYAQGETCYPVKLIYGHMAQLVEAGVDYIFLPSIRTMKHEASKVANNYGCVYMQTAPKSVARALDLEGHGITLLNPVFDLDFGKKAMASAMLGVGKQLGKLKPLCLRAMMKGADAVRRHTQAVEQQGKSMLDTLMAQDKVLVLITRNYGIADPVLNMGIPKLLLDHGCKVLTLSHLPAHDLDLSSDYPNLYWPFGQHIISGVKLVAHHPNLYAVCLTNHGCGPDSMLSHMVRTEMGDKPWLQIEVDEHFSKVGVITRVEAFLNSLNSRPAQPLPTDFDLKSVPAPPVRMQAQPERDSTLYLPPLGRYDGLIGELLRQNYGAATAPMAWAGVRGLTLGRAETNAKEYLPFTALLDASLRTAQVQPGPIQLLIPETEGAEADGLYGRAIRAVLDRKGLDRVTLVSPLLETLPDHVPDRNLLFRALLAGDLLYAAPAHLREELTPVGIPTWEELYALARRIGSEPVAGRLLGAVGTPMCLTILDDGLLDVLEREGDTILRAPLTEYLWFLWRDKGLTDLDDLAVHMADLGKLLGRRSAFGLDVRLLRQEAERQLPGFAGGNGRYRWTKAVELSGRCAGVLTLAPRYENTAAVLDMRGLSQACRGRLFQVALDGDWDESAWSRLRSFLYYCE